MIPVSAEERLAEGIALHRRGMLPQSIACYRSLAGTHVALDALVNLGAALDETGETAEAVACYREALALSPAHPLAHYNLGNALMKLGRHAEAVERFRSALLSAPGCREARLALGAALQAAGDLAGALRTFREATAEDPSDAEAHWYLSLALLSDGDFCEGWREYEWRWQKPSFTSLTRSFTEPLWDGSPLWGRRILLHGEQGLGDTIHFIRYAPLVASAGGTVLVECQSRSLKPLLERIPGVSSVSVLGEGLPPFDLQIPLLSLPRLFGTAMETIPAQVPYLSPDPQRVSAWRERIGKDAGFKIGVAWAGKAVPDPFRSCELSDLAPLAAIPETSFYSLQLGAEGRGTEGALPLADHTGAIRDFADTAALVSLLDLVISVDTSVAHLAGALGKPVFLMLPKACDWRWLRDRDDSPWYPTMRLFRQKEQGEWREVVREIAAALKDAVWSHLERGSAREPMNADRAYACGTFLAEEGRVREACARFMKAAFLEPKRWQAHYSLGVALQRMGLIPQAQEAFADGIAADSGVPLLHEVLGVVLQMGGDLPAACASYRRALELDPLSLRSLYNLGTACRELGQLAEALHFFERVAERSPGHADARWNRAVLLLMHGDLTRGWGEFRWRFRKSSAAPERHPDTPRWDGSPLQGRTILLHAEQGLGDTVQFVRYAPLVAARGGRVILEVQAASLLPLLEGLPGVAGVVAAGEPLPEFQARASLMDLPAIFGTTLETIPAAPYLAADEELKEIWRQRLPGGGTFRVGLVWKGSSRHENDANRSLSLAAFAPLAGTAAVSFHSVQLGDGAAQLDAPFPLHDLTSQIGDFSDTAALVTNLDLVITVDTCVAHLCGALGVPTWVLIPLVPDWRWLLDREDSPWYPTLRLFRQKKLGDWGEVLQRVREALAAHLDRERTAHRHKMRGMILAEEGRHAEAAEAFEAALVMNPLDPESYNNLGSALDSQGKLQEAVARYQKAIALNDTFVAPHYNLGNTLKTIGHIPQAIECYRRALELEPGLVQGWHNLALALRCAGKPEEARAALETALTVEPRYLAAGHSLGELLHDGGDLPGAEEAFRRVLELDPSYLPSLNALGITLQTAGRPQEAVSCYQRALAVKPDYLHALNNLGAALRSLGRLQEAVSCYRRGMAVDPDYADAHWNLSLVLLHLGEFREGWRLYEWRFLKVEPIATKEVPQPRWDGSSPAGRTILLHSEQGFGDTIQFARYASVVAAMGGKVYLECQVPALKPLLSTVPGVSGVIARGEILPRFDMHAPLMSLPHLCGTTLETIPAAVPYLSVDPCREALWRGKVSEGGVRVGLVWAGRKTYKDDKKRSLSLSLFAPLARVAGASFYMLQMGDGAEQAADPPPGLKVHDLTGGIRDFADTAAFISTLDLVISADTAVAHLAGALGKAVWVLVPYACDWRWLTEREDSPWYPTARLFRQREAGDWGGVLDRVACALEEIAGGASARKKVV
ncbi:tetratricopeptide repeat protein [Geomonas sp. RF6]|uniref:tetratricopeptide repeat protein n=1 Tax=Geomonas sp. RF6 TaxID=2897342 RepID=UPI001E640D00|nr:tetratricopeptide repeat protein [Geomonas sp. RF6]UFS72415.1 tetratricopeptide repeat protein [Geomonas sp. RF6]